MSHKIQWVDTLKWFGMFTVILGHMSSPFSGLIYSFHMPLFFMLSGFFLRFSQPVAETAKKDFRRLMIPYFIFSFLGLGFEVLKRIALNRPSLEILVELKGILWSMDYEGLQHHYGFVLWFLPTLFFSRQLISLIYRLLSSKILRVGAVLLIFTFSFYISLPFGLDHAMNAVFWLWLGHQAFGIYEKGIAIPFLIAILAALLIQGIWLGIPALNVAEKFYSSIPLNILWASLAVSFLAGFLKKIKMEWGKTWANETMLLFIFHPYTNNIGHLIVEKVNPDFWWAKLIISVALLQVILKLKLRFPKRSVFQYV